MAVTTKAGLTNDFQNNSAMALFGMSKKLEGGSPYKSPAEVAAALLDAIKAADDEGIFEKQFIDLNQYEQLPLEEFVDALCESFTKYQRYTDGAYQVGFHALVDFDEPGHRQIS